MAACRLAAKGRTLADASYESEVNSITAFLQLQRPAPAPAINPNSLDIIPEDYVASRFAKKFKGKVIKHLRVQIYVNKRSKSYINFTFTVGSKNLGSARKR